MLGAESLELFCLWSLIWHWFIILFMVSLHILQLSLHCNSSTRGHKIKLMKAFSRVNSSAFCFANICNNAQNSLSNDTAYVSSACF